MGLSTSKSDINVAIAVWDDWTTYYKIEDQKAGLRLITSPWKRPAPDTIHMKQKLLDHIYLYSFKIFCRRKRLSRSLDA